MFGTFDVLTHPRSPFIIAQAQAQAQAQTGLSSVVDS